MAIPIGPQDFCDFTRAFPSYQQVVRGLTSFLPEAFLFVSYPILLFKVSQLKKTRVAHNNVERQQEPVGPSLSASPATGPSTVDAFQVILPWIGIKT